MAAPVGFSRLFGGDPHAVMLKPRSSTRRQESRSKIPNHLRNERMDVLCPEVSVPMVALVAIIPTEEVFAPPIPVDQRDGLVLRAAESQNHPRDNLTTEGIRLSISRKVPDPHSCSKPANDTVHRPRRQVRR